MPFPQMFRLQQNFEAPRVENVEAEVQKQLATLNLGAKIQPGQTVAITAGSRGIANIAKIIKATVAHFRELGAEPFIVPAMGSHGGARRKGNGGFWKVTASHRITWGLRFALRWKP